MEITLNLPTLHRGQKQIEAGLKRFNVICCGRRFGKTEYGFERIIMPALDGFPVAWFAPSYRTMKEVWDKAQHVLAPVIQKTDSQSKAITLITGGKIEFWSLENAHVVRGRKYKHVVIDEAAHARGMKDIWNRIIRPLLTDYQGSADFMSTPNGKANFFFEAAQRNGQNGWAFFQMPTAANPYIAPEEIEAARLELDRLTFAQEYLAEFVDFVGMPFAYAFDKDKHVKEMAFNPALPLILSFDFGVDPMPAVALQVNHFPKEVNVLKEFHIFNGDIYRLLTEVKMWVSSLGKPAIIKVTGDPSGASRNPLSEGAANAFRVIKDGLNVGRQYVQAPKRFSIVNSRALVNSILEHIPVNISPGCKLLLQDLQYVEVESSDGGVRLKKTGKNAAAGASNEMLTHLLDAFRYAMHLEFYDYSVKLRNTKTHEKDDDDF